MDPEDLQTSPYQAPVMMPAPINPTVAAGVLGGHRSNLGALQTQQQEAKAKRQAMVDRATAVLDEATNALKSSREGWRINMPLLSAGAGFFKPTRYGNASEQIGNGLEGLLRGIAMERGANDDYQSKLANLGMRRSEIEMGPLDNEMKFNQALQLAEMAGIRQAEGALIRSASTATNRADKEKAQLQRAMQAAVAGAEREFSSTYKQTDLSDTEAVEAIKRDLLLKHINMQRAAGFNIPDDVITSLMGGAPNPIVQTGGPTGSAPRMQPKGQIGFANEAEAIRLGLPAAPEVTEYSGLQPKEQADTYKGILKNFAKTKDDWLGEDKQFGDSLALLKRFEQLQQKPGVVGRRAGILPGSMVPNFSPEAQELQKIIRQLEAQQFVKGQGAVSNYERQLFSQQVPNMDNSREANQNIINVMKASLERNADRRKFLTSYFNAYKTLSGANEAWDEYLNADDGGSYVVPGEGGVLMPNPKRRGWQDYFRSKRQPVEKARGGAIHLGAEYDG